MTDNEIIKALKCCISTSVEGCRECPFNTPNCYAKVPMVFALDLINRQKEEVEELNECYTNLSNASLQHSIDNAKDRELLCEYQSIFLDLGFALEVSDPELKEIKAWKDRMLWHCKRADELLTENNKLKAEIERLQSVNADMQESLRLAAEANKDMQAEIERLREAKYIFATVDYCSDDLHEALDEIDRLKAEIEALKKVVIDDYATEYDEKIKAEAIKEFAERLKEYFTNFNLQDQIDCLAKEMTSPQECPDCKHFVGCETATKGSICNIYEKEDKK